MSEDRMMKSCWLTDRDRTVLNTLSIESENLAPEYMRIKVTEVIAPQNPTPEHPLRHVIVLNFLTDDDLIELHNKIRIHLTNKGVI